MRRVAISGLGALMLVGCWSCQGRDAAPAHARMQTVMVTQPRRQDAIRQITLPGDLTGFFQATLYAKVTGYLSKINVDKGDWIRSGEVLAEIEVPELAHRLGHEQATLQINQLTYQRLEHVWKSDPRLVAREDVDIAYAKYQESVSNVAE